MPTKITPVAKIFQLTGIAVTILLVFVFFISQFQKKPDSLLASTEPEFIKDINSGPTGSSIDNGTALNGEAYFEADDGIHGLELWKSDGTESGTVLVKDIYTGSFDSDPLYSTAFDGNVYFTADVGTNGKELWKSDGTESGTVLVKDINSGSSDSFPASLIAGDDYLYFIAEDGTTGIELWRSDGTESGTVLVKDINDIAPETNSNITNLTLFNGVLYFAADDGVNGKELWKSDGTESGTVLVKDINASAFSGSGITGMGVANGSLYFNANDGLVGNELWKSDGTESGTVLVKDIRAGGLGSTSSHFTAVGNVLYFSANDGTNGFELWKSDGTESGTVLVKDINPSGNGTPLNLTEMDGTLYFIAAIDGTNYELWKSDGTESGTVLVKDDLFFDPAGGNPDPLIEVNSKLYSLADDGIYGYELWQSDGTEAGTILLKDFNVGVDGSYPEIFAVAGNTLFMYPDDGTHGSELWIYTVPEVVSSSESTSTDTKPPSDDFGNTDFEITSVSGIDVDEDVAGTPLMYAISDTPDVEFSIIRDESGIKKYEFRLTNTDMLGRKKGGDYAWIEDIDADSATDSKPRVHDNMEIRYIKDKVIVEPSDKRKLANGTYYLMVRAFDNAGNHTDSDEIKLVIGQTNSGNVVVTSIGSIPFNPNWKNYYYASNTLVLNGTGKGSVKIDDEVIAVDGFTLRKQLTTGLHTVTAGTNTFTVQLDPTRATFPESLK